jgi:DNA-binding NarL/FixJ family response regulator
MGPLRVAIVDDNEVFADSLAQRLALEGASSKVIAPMATAEETLARVLAWRPEVVVIDVWLARRWSGSTVASVLDTCGTRVIVATASPSVGLPRGCRAAVFDKARSQRELVELVLGAHPAMPA